MKLLDRKEALFKQYYKTTELALASEDPEEVASLIDDRDKLISQINEIDLQAANCESNTNIKQMITEIFALDKGLRKKIQGLKEEAQGQMRSIKNAQKLRNDYEPSYAMSDGAFYDKRR